MNLRFFHKKLIFRLKFLTFGLIVSVAINVAFLIHLIIEKKENILAISNPPLFPKEIKSLSLEEIIVNYKTLPYLELVFLLENKEVVEQGLLKRDVALSTLVAYHYFDYVRALGNFKVEKKEIQNPQDPSKKIYAFLGLGDFEFSALSHFAKTEKWPISMEGMLSFLKKSHERPESLIQALSMKEEYELIYNLFEQTNQKVTKENLIEILKEIRFEVLDNFIFEQKQIQELSDKRRRNFLLLCLDEKSPSAAKLFIKEDFSFVVNGLSEDQVFALLDISSDPELESLQKKLSEALLESFRSEAIKMFCVKKFPDLSNKLIKKELSLNLPSKKNLSKTKVTSSKTSKRVHKVKENETLWKIARKYKVEVSELKKVNRLKNEKLKVGATLTIP